jgi:hypothetical protein
MKTAGSSRNQPFINHANADQHHQFADPLFGCRLRVGTLFRLHRQQLGAQPGCNQIPRKINQKQSQVRCLAQTLSAINQLKSRKR